MAVESYNHILKKLGKAKNEYKLNETICKNIRRIRIEKCSEFKKTMDYTAINPYTSENIASLLGYSHTHYKRYESDSDKTKKIPLIKLIQLAIILDVPIEEFLKQ